MPDPDPNDVPRSRPALRTAGIGLGFPGAAVVLGLVVEQLLDTGFADWKSLLAKVTAFAALAGWAWLTARHPETETGYAFFDKPKGGG